MGTNTAAKREWVREESWKESNKGRGERELSDESQALASLQRLEA